MAKYSITAMIGASMKGFNAGLAAGGRQAKGFGSKLQGAIGHPAVQAAAMAGKAIVDFGMEAVQTAGQIDAKMNEVFTLLPTQSEEMKKKMTDQMLALSAEMGKMPEDMIGSLYNALSAGVPKDNVFDFLKTATKASIGGVSTVEEAVGALTTVLNGYKMPATEAANVSDTLFTVIKNGVTTMPELAANIGKVTPIAYSLGVSFDDVGAAFAEMTKNLGPGKSAETGTMLKAMFSELGKASSDSFAHFKEATGKTFPEFMKAGGNLAEGLLAMQKRADKLGLRLPDLFNSVEAGGAALILTAEGAEGLTKQMGAMTEKAGASEGAFKTVDTGFSRMMEKLKAGFEVFKHTVGTALGPLVDVLMPLLLKGLKMIQKLPWDKLGQALGDNTKLMEPIMEMLLELVAELFPLIPPLIKIFMSSIMALMPAMGAIVKILILLMPIIVWIIEKIAILFDWFNAIMGAITKLIGGIGRGKDEAKEGTDGVVEGVEEVSDKVASVLKFFISAWNWIKDAFSDAWKWIKETVDTVSYFGEMVWRLVSWPVKQVWKLCKWVGGKVADLLEWMWGNIKDTVNAILDLRNYLKDKLFEMFPWLEDLIDGIKAFIVDTVMSVWYAISDFFEGIWTGIKQLFKDFRESVMSAEGDTAEALQYMWILIEEIVGGAIDLFKKLWEIVKFVGFVIKEIGGAIFGAKSETQDLNKELDQTAEKMEIVKEETEKTANECEREEKSRERSLKFEEFMAKAKKRTGVEVKKQRVDAEAIEATSKRGLAQEKLRRFQQQASVQEGAKIIKNSGVNVKLLQATIGKHKEVNSMAQLYSIIASGKKTPAQLIEEAQGKQSTLNVIAKAFGIKNAKGQTPEQQLKGALGVTKEMNAEAAKNPLIKLQKGEMKITVTGGFDKASIKTLLGLMKSIAHTNASIDKNLKGKFVNQ